MAPRLVFGSPTGPAQYGDDEDKENTPRPPVTLSMEDVEEADSDDEIPELADQQQQPLLRGGFSEAAQSSIIDVAEEEVDISEVMSHAQTLNNIPLITGELLNKRPRRGKWKRANLIH